MSPGSGARRNTRRCDHRVNGAGRASRPCSSRSISAARTADRLAELRCWRERGRDRARRGGRPAHRADPALFAGSGKVEEIARRRAPARFAHRHLRSRALPPRSNVNLERAPECRVFDRTELDPRHLRAARPLARRQASGRARAAPASRDAPRARLDPPGAPERRHRQLAGRARRRSKSTAA